MASILLVEDDDLVAKLLAMVLRRAGHDPITARNGMEALEVCRSSRGEIAMVISDVIMPGMSGPEWVREAGSALSRVPVTYITGHTDGPCAALDLMPEGSDLLVKPVNVVEFLKLIARRIAAN